MILTKMVVFPTLQAKLRIMKSIAFLLILFAAKGSWAANFPYTLKQNRDTVSLVQSATGRVMWTQKAAGSAPIWSADRRALALENSGKTLLWREGGQLTAVPNPAIPGSGGTDHYDYAMGGVWSPDKRRFLARYGASGMSDVGPTGVGQVFCFKLHRNGRYTSNLMPSPDYATKLAWRDNQTALYRTLNKRTHQPNRNPRRWRVP